MKQISDEVFAQVRDALKHGITRMNILGEARPCMPLHEALAALDTAQPVQVNAMLVEALKELVQEKCDYMLRNKLGNPEIEHTTRQARAALTAAQQAQPKKPLKIEFTKEWCEAAAVYKAAKDSFNTVSTKNGQANASISVCGVRFDLTTLGRESGWMPYVIKGMEELHSAALKVAEIQMMGAKKKLEDAKWKVQLASKELTCLQ